MTPKFVLTGGGAWGWLIGVSSTGLEWVAYTPAEIPAIQRAFADSMRRQGA